MPRPGVRAHFLLLLIAALAIGSVPGSAQITSAVRIVLQTIGLPGIDRGVSVLEPRAPGSAVTRVVRTAVLGGRPADRVGKGGASYVPGRVIVKFRGGVSGPARLNTVAAVAAGSIATRPPNADFDIVNIDPGEDAEAVAAAFSLRADVEYAQAAYRVHAYSFPNDPPNDQFYDLQWNFPQIRLDQAWEIQPGGIPSIIVAVLDSGVAFEDSVIQFRASAFSSGSDVYPSLGNILVPFARATDLATSAARFVSPRDFIYGDTEPVDLDGHGTHVAGTIGQLTNNGAGVAGVAFNVSLMPVKVISEQWDEIFGAPNSGTDDVVAQGIRYAADNGAQVINMSIGRPGPPAPAVESAMRYAVGRGCFIVVAGGNDFENGNPFEALADIPQRIAGAVAVAATDRAQGRAYYSSTGPYIEIAAPGGSFRVGGNLGLVYQQTFDFDFVETFDLPVSQYKAPRFDVLAYVGFQGTSMAAPHVAGLAALLMSQGLTDPVAIEAAIKRFATDLGARGRDDAFGYGQIDALNTVRGLGLAR